MRKIEVDEAGVLLGQLVADMKPGEEVALTRDGRVVAKLSSIPSPQKITLGLARGKFTVPDDFDAPLPDDVIALFEGR